MIPPSTPDPTPIERAETAAAYAAMRVYFEVLRAELGKLGERSVLEALGGTGHIHYALVDGDAPGLVRFTFAVTLDKNRPDEKVGTDRPAKGA